MLYEAFKIAEIFLELLANSLYYTNNDDLKLRLDEIEKKLDFIEKELKQ